jgi:hypothetical protein
MEKVLLGIVILVRPLQEANAQFPIEVTLLGIAILVRPLHPENDSLPSAVTLEGIVMFVRVLQPLNAPSPIEVTGRPSIVLGMITDLAVPVYPVMVIIPAPRSYVKFVALCARSRPGRNNNTVKINLFRMNMEPGQLGIYGSGLDGAPRYTCFIHSQRPNIQKYPKNVTISSYSMDWTQSIKGLKA